MHKDLRIAIIGWKERALPRQDLQVWPGWKTKSVFCLWAAMLQGWKWFLINTDICMYSVTMHADAYICYTAVTYRTHAWKFKRQLSTEGYKGKFTPMHVCMQTDNQTHMLTREHKPHNGLGACTLTNTHTDTHTCAHKSVFGNVTFSQKPPFPASAPLPLWLCEDWRGQGSRFGGLEIRFHMTEHLCWGRPAERKRPGG